MNSDPNILVVATSVRNEFEGNALVAALAARGITATVFGEAAATMQWEAGYTDPYKVMVRREDEAAARAMIAEIRSSSEPGVDWNEIDVNQAADRLSDGMVCWSCGHRLGGLTASTRTCPACNAEVFPEESSDPAAPAAAETENLDSYAHRTRAFRRTGLVLVFLPLASFIGGGIILGIYEYPRLGAFLVLFAVVVATRKLLVRS